MSVNRNHWSTKEVEILLHYGADVAATKLGRSLDGCKQKEKSIKQEESGEKKKRNNRYGFDDQIRILTNSPDYVAAYYKLDKVQAYNCRVRFKKELNQLKSLEPDQYSKYIKAISKAGGIWKAGKANDVEREKTTARYQRMKDKLTFIHEDRVSSAEELPVSEPAFLTVPEEAYDFPDYSILEPSRFEVNYPDRVPSPNTPEPALTIFERIWNTVTKW